MEADNSGKLLPRALWAKILVLCAYAVIGVGLLWGASRVLPAALPFIAAWAAAWAVARPSDVLSQRTGAPRGVIAALLTALLLAALGFTVFRLGGRALTEAGRLVDALGRGVSGLGERIAELTQSLGERFPALDGAGDGGMIENSVNELIGGCLSRASSFVAESAGGMVAAAPSAALFLTVTVVASFYFACGYHRILGWVRGAIPRKINQRIGGYVGAVAKTLRTYLKASVILAVVTFVLLAAGFLIMRLDYVLISAFLTALVDFLPVFGVGTVLIPWAGIEFICGNYGTGIGLLVLYAVCLFVRQLLEPRLISKSVGLHPAATLAAMYFGFRLLGILGMIFLPLVVTLLFAASRHDSH